MSHTVDLGKDARNYVRSLPRISREWGKWDECTQVRRHDEQHYEFRRSTPLCLVTGLMPDGLAFDFLILGLFVKHGDFLKRGFHP
jgi:hypothetical protein